jgi:membrane fusion protein, multidrug efflux system
MKTRIVLAFLILIVVSCGKNDDKTAKLQKLKDQRDKINTEIEKLEIEIKKNGNTAINNNPVAVNVNTVVPKEFKHYIEVQGKIDGEENVSVSAQTMGVIKAIYVKAGQTVKKGQVLADIDADVLYQSLAEVQQQLQFATDLYNKQKSLWDKKIGSEVQYLTAKNNKESMEKRSNTLKDQIDMYKIKSPINGTVEDLPIKIGQNIAPGLTAVRVINFSSVKAIAEVAEAFSSKIKMNDDVKIFFPDLNKEISSKISFTSKFINPVNRTFVVESKFVPEGDNVSANMIAIVKINDYVKESAIVIPVNIIQNSMGSKYVFVVKQENNKKVARKQDIQPGLTYNGLVEVLSGLNSGDQIITIGYQDLKEGQIINF